MVKELMNKPKMTYFEKLKPHKVVEATRNIKLRGGN